MLQTKETFFWFLVIDLNISDNFYKTQNFKRSLTEKVLFIIMFNFKWKGKDTMFIYFTTCILTLFDIGWNIFIKIHSILLFADIQT